MGYYIQAPTRKDKANFLIAEYGAKIVGHDSDVPEWDENEAIICVVDNGAFEAAGFAYSPQELSAFAAPDRGDYQRPCVWLKMDLAKAKELSGYGR